MIVMIKRIGLMGLLLMLTGCAMFEKQVESMKPTARPVGMRLANINFDQADLVFDLAVDNPNPIAIKLAGVNYDLRIENQSLISGITASGLEIAESSSSNVEVPVTLKFDDLKKLSGDIWKKDRIAYMLDANIVADLPVIGNYAIPISKTGELPVPKLPSIKLKDADIKKLGLVGAEIVAKVEVANPNDFDLGFKDFKYQLSVNQQTWGQGEIRQAQSVPKNGRAIIEIPLSLDLLGLGEIVQHLLYSKEPFDYRLNGDITLDTGIEMLRNFKMPLNVSGKSAIN